MSSRLPHTVPGQAFHDREEFYTEKRSKVFAIMETPQETRRTRQARAGMSHSGALETGMR
jgi:hypothetical protein